MFVGRPGGPRLRRWASRPPGPLPREQQEGEETLGEASEGHGQRPGSPEIPFNEGSGKGPRRDDGMAPYIVQLLVV